jgi:hypothetical protein
MRPDGSIVLIEQQGVYFDKERAARTCENEFWTVKTLPIDIPLPKESVQYKGHRSPQSVMPDRYRRRTFPAPVPVHQLKQIERAFKTISEKATGI